MNDTISSVGPRWNFDLEAWPFAVSRGNLGGGTDRLQNVMAILVLQLPSRGLRPSSFGLRPKSKCLVVGPIREDVDAMLDAKYLVEPPDHHGTVLTSPERNVIVVIWVVKGTW